MIDFDDPKRYLNIGQLIAKRTDSYHDFEEQAFADETTQERMVAWIKKNMEIFCRYYDDERKRAFFTMACHFIGNATAMVGEDQITEDYKMGALEMLDLMLGGGTYFLHADVE